MAHDSSPALSETVCGHEDDDDYSQNLLSSMQKQTEARMESNNEEGKL